MVGGNPWRQLRAQSDIVLEWSRLPDNMLGAYVEKAGGVRTIVLDERLDREERRATLCHELIHAERGITGEERFDERGVEDEVARRLVPFDELAAMWEVATLNDLPVEPWMLAEKFDVPDDVAERAMRLFLGGNK